MTETTIPPARSAAKVLVGAAICALALLAASASAGSCAPPTPAQVEKAESDLCKARALERVAIALSDGKLEPEPGSVRADVARAVDELCAARATTDAGSAEGGSKP